MKSLENFTHPKKRKQYFTCDVITLIVSCTVAANIIYHLNCGTAL